MFSVRHGGGSFPFATVELSDDAGCSATIAYQYGFQCYSFQRAIHGQLYELLHAEPGFPNVNSKPSRAGTPILAPFPNRIAGGTFSYAGKEYSLPRNEAGKNAIHGFVIDQPWRITDEGADAESAWARGEFQLHRDRPEARNWWPADFSLSITYRLTHQYLRAHIEVHNPDTRVLPFGFGTHPYFRFPLTAGNAENCEIVVPANQQVVLRDCLPTGGLQPVAGLADLRGGQPLGHGFDDVFTDLTPALDGRVHHGLRDRVAGVELALVHDNCFPFVVVYTPAHRESICIEPYTCVTDAIHDEGKLFPTGLWHLQPNESRGFSIDYIARAF